MTVPVLSDPPANQTDLKEKSEQPSTLRRRGLFAAAAALFAAVITKPKEVAATAGTGADGNLVMGSHFINSPNTANTVTVITPGLANFTSAVLMESIASIDGGTAAHVNGFLGQGRGVGSGVIGVTGFATGSGGNHSTDFANCGVIGYGNGAAIGVAGYSTTGWAMLGQSGTGGVGVYGISPFAATVGLGQGNTAIGVWGQTNGANGYGVYGNATTSLGIGVYGQGSPWAAAFAGGVFVNGALTVVNGAKSAAVPHPDGSLRRLYCVESPESWFEDFGEAKLVNGVARVELDPDFAAVVKNDTYHVFLTPNGDSKGLFIDVKTCGGFEVREQQGGSSDLTFSYRVVAKRKDIAGPRFENVEAPDFSASERREPLEVPQRPQEGQVSRDSTVQR